MHPRHTPLLLLLVVLILSGGWLLNTPRAHADTSTSSLCPSITNGTSPDFNNFITAVAYAAAKSGLSETTTSKIIVGLVNYLRNNCSGGGTGGSGGGGANPINGSCGSASGSSVSSAPANNLCSAGSASSVSGTGPWAWTCNGSNGGTNASCSASKTAGSQPVNGACGSANGSTVASAPTSNLCSAGSSSSVSGSGPWSWSCNGSNGGSNASCSASKSSGGGGGGNGTFGVKASGSKLISTKDGSPVELIGMNMSGCETSQGGGARCDTIANAGENFWATTFKNAHSGTNTVRIPLDALEWLGSSCTGAAPNYQSDIKTIVNEATAAGLYVILDLHWSAPNGQCDIGQPGFADADHDLTFWKQIADTFGQQPNVIFELFNEPYGTTNEDLSAPILQTLANGGNFSPFVQQDNSNGNAFITKNVTYNVAGEKQMLAAIRGEGATNLVLASPIWFAGEIETWLATYNTSGNPDPLHNFGASMHAYGYDEGLGNLSNVLAAGYPMVITEFENPVGNLGSPTWFQQQGIGLIGWGPNDWSGSLTVNPTGW